jgi:putative salt-induced outer membrane protein
MGTTSKIALAALAFGILIPELASADPIPEPIIQIIREAAKTGNAATLQTTVNLAKTTNPRSVAEIDALVANLQQESEAVRTARLSTQGFFEGWKGEGEVGASLTTGTSKNKTVAVGVNLTKDGLNWRHKLVGVANYVSSNDTTTADRYLASYQADYKFTPRLFAYGLLQWEQDRFAGFNRRFTESLGLGYTIIDTPMFNWQISGGPALRQTKLITHETQSDTTAHAGTTFLWNISPTTVFTEDLGTYVGGSDNTYFSTTALTTKIMGDISARASFNVISESDPPPGIESTNTITRLTLVYSF